MRPPRLLLLIVVAASAAACGGVGAAQPSSPPTAAAVSSPAAAGTPSATTAPASARPTSAATSEPTLASTLLGDPIPTALQGTWQVDDPTKCAGCGWFLTLSARGYVDYKSSLTAGKGGPAGIQGSTLLLGGPGGDCPTTARYRWALPAQKRLTLTPLGQDPCPRGAELAPYTLDFVNDNLWLVHQAPLTGAAPTALLGTWIVEGTANPSQKFVFGLHTLAAWTTSVDDVAAAPLGVLGNEFTIGPRSDGGCEAVGIYQWTLATPTELRTVALGPDLCPRGTYLAKGTLHLASRSTEPIPPGD